MEGRFYMRGYFAPNEIFADTYQIVREIGHGGSGVVYLAYHLRLQKYVVIKRLKIRLTNETLMRTEADALKNLHHPALPQVYDYIVESDGVYTVMDYIEGSDLQNVPCGAANLSEQTLLSWLRQLAEVLDYLHSRKVRIIHSDIKPGNVILRPDGTVCLIDFNISLGGDIGEMLKGVSPFYASPEQIALSHHVLNGGEVHETLDPRTDIYSLGATFYYLITGTVPDPNYRITPLSSMQNLGYSQPFLSIVDRCMAYDRRARYQSAAKLGAALMNLKKQDARYKRYVIGWVAALLLAGTLAAGGAYCLVRGIQAQAYDAYRSDYEVFHLLLVNGENAAAVTAGQELLSNGRYDAVFAAHREEHAAILRALGDLKYESGEYGAAASYYSDALSDAESAGIERDAYYRDYATALAKSGSLDAADRVLAQADDAGVSGADLHLIRASIAMQRGDINTCLAEAQAALDDASEDDLRARACAEAGAALMRKGDPESAVDWLVRANAYEPRPSTLRAQAEAYIDLYQAGGGAIASRSFAQKAAETYEILRTSAMFTENDYLNYSNIAGVLGQKATVIKLLEECRATYGDSFPVLVALAYAEYDTGELAQARNLCAAASNLYEKLSSEQREPVAAAYADLQKLDRALN